MALLIDNYKFSEGGGLTAVAVKKRLSPGAAKLAIGVGMPALSIAETLLKESNAAKLGQVTYHNSTSRMTKSFNTGAVQAIAKIADGDTQIANNMLSKVTRGNFGIIDNVVNNYGADSSFVSAFYGMNGV